MALTVDEAGILNNFLQAGKLFLARDIDTVRLISIFINIKI